MRDPNARNNLDLLTGGMLIGYSRASLVDQKLDLQRDALERAGCAQIYEDKAIGRAKAGRQEMANALRSLRAGDMLVVWRLDRLSRNLTDLVNIINELAVKKIGFKSLTEKIDTSSALGGTFFEVFDSIAQYMRDVGPARQLGRDVDEHGVVADVIAHHQVTALSMHEHTSAGVGAAGLIIEDDNR